ncbi:MAG: hypothetical protein H6945_08590 [Zoogloeaceae bacterium]|nr:hypothetical protein [Zoogloeaceae bacterium]
MKKYENLSDWQQEVVHLLYLGDGSGSKIQRAQYIRSDVEPNFQKVVYSASCECHQFFEWQSRGPRRTGETTISSTCNTVPAVLTLISINGTGLSDRHKESRYAMGIRQSHSFALTLRKDANHTKKCVGYRTFYSAA